jgi:hypothetical protein
MKDEDDLNFNKDALDEAYNTNKKKFLASLPINSTNNFIFVAMLLIALLSSLNFIKIPTKINAQGEIKIETPEKIIFSDVGSVFFIKNISVSKNEKIYDKNKPLITLSSINYKKNKDFLDNLINQINFHEKEINTTNKQYFSENKKTHEVLNKHEEILKLSIKEYEEKTKYLNSIKKSFSKGLISKREVEDSRTVLSNLNIENAIMKKEQQSLLLNLIKLEKERINKISNIKENIFKIKNNIYMHKSKNNIEIFSPCTNCYVKEIFLKTGDIVKGKNPILSIKNNNETNITKASLYIKNTEFSEIKKNSLIKIKVKSYPYLKHGTLTAKITYISETPINNTSNSNNDFVYLVEADISSNHDSIILKDGMAIEAHIIKNEVPLYKFLTKKIL